MTDPNKSVFGTGFGTSAPSFGNWRPSLSMPSTPSPATQTLVPNTCQPTPTLATSASPFGRPPVSSSSGPSAAFGSVQPSTPTASVFGASSMSAFASGNQLAQPTANGSVFGTGAPFSSPARVSESAFGSSVSTPSPFATSNPSLQPLASKPSSTASNVSTLGTLSADAANPSTHSRTAFGTPVQSPLPSPFAMPASGKIIFAVSSGSGASTPMQFNSSNLKVNNEATPLQKQEVTAEDRAKRFTIASEAGILREKMKKERDEREENYYKNYKPMNLEEARDVVGICMEMCPEFECYDREVTQELHYFEMLAGTEHDPEPRVDRSKAVKKYRRSAAGKDPEIFPEDIRPPAILKKTMDYLLNEILEREDQEFVEIYNFIRDRGRALRKDFKVQNHLKGAECVYIMETLARFLIHSDFVLCDLPESKFSWKQNRHQIFDTLTTLMEIYDDGLQENIIYPCEAEFRAYYILLSIDDPVAVSRYQYWRKEILANIQVVQSLKFYYMFQNRLFEPFFSQLASTDTSYLMGCILQVPSEQLRKEGLKILNMSFMARDNSFSFRSLKTVLGLNGESEATDYARFFGLEIVEGVSQKPIGVRFGKKDGNRTIWIEPVASWKMRKSNLLLQKANQLSHTKIVTGALSEEAITETKKKGEITVPSPTFASMTSRLNTNEYSFGSSLPEVQVPAIVEKKAQAAVARPIQSPVSIPQSQKEQGVGMKLTPLKTSSETCLKVAENLTDAIILEFIDNLVQKTCLRSKFENSLSSSHADEILSTVVSENICIIIQEELQLKNLKKQLATSIITELFYSIIDELTRAACFEIAAVNFCHRRSKLMSFRSWFCYTKYKREKKRIEEQRKNSFRTCMRAMPLLSPSIKQQQQTSTLASNLRDLNLLQEFTNNIVKNIRKKDALENLETIFLKYRQPLELPRIVCGVVNKKIQNSNSERNLQFDVVPFKLVIGIDDGTSGVGKGISKWLLDKFRIGGLPFFQNDSTATIETLAFFDVKDDSGAFSPQIRQNLEQTDAITSNVPLAIIVQAVRNIPVIYSESVSNSESCLSGTSAILFYIPNIGQAIDDTFWAQETARLSSIENNLPSGCSIPLAILYWSDEICTKHQIINRLQLSSRTFKSFALFSLGSGVSKNQSVVTANCQLENAITWLSGESEPCPDLKFEVLNDVIYFVPEKLQCILSKFAQERKFSGINRTMLQVAIKCFDETLSMLETLICNEQLTRITYPAREFSESDLIKRYRSILPVSWNARSRIESYHKSFSRYKLSMILSQLSLSPAKCSGALIEQLLWKLVKAHCLSVDQESVILSRVSFGSLTENEMILILSEIMKQLIINISVEVAPAVCYCSDYNMFLSGYDRKIWYFMENYIEQEPSKRKSPPHSERHDSCLDQLKRSRFSTDVTKKDSDSYILTLHNELMTKIKRESEENRSLENMIECALRK